MSRRAGVIVVVVATAVAACNGSRSMATAEPPDSGNAPDAALADDAPLADAAPIGPIGPDPFGPLRSSTPACSSDGWCWSTPAPHGNEYDHVFSTAPDNIWLTAWGFVEQWDGQSWTSHHPPIGSDLTGSQFSMSIGGSSASNMWLIYGPQLEHWDGTTWTILESLPNSGSPNYNNVWVSPDGDAWVTISNGTLEHWHAGVETTLGAGGFLGSIWGTSATDIYITTLPAGILHYDGQTFTRIYDGPEILGGFSGVPGDVWVSGGEGGMGHWDGTTFTDVALPDAIAGQWIQPIAYRAANDIWWFVLFSGGGFLHWDGTAMTFTPIPSTDDIGATDFDDGAIIGGRWWLVGGYGAIYTADNSAAIPTLEPVTQASWYNLTSIWGGSDDDLYVTAGFALSHYDGSAATNVELDFGSIYGSVTYVTGLRTNGVDELYVAGQVQTVAGYPGEYVDVVFHYDGATWTRAEFDTAPSGSTCGIEAIAALAPGDAVGVGACGVAYHYANGVWTAITTNTTNELYAVWASDADHLWAIGALRTVLEWDRSAPTAMTPDPVPASLTTGSPYAGGLWPLGAITGVNGYPWIASTEQLNGALYERSSTGWTEVVAPVTGDTGTGFVAISPTNVVFSMGDESHVFRFDGTNWNYEDNASYLGMGALFAVPGGRMWAGGDNGIVYHP